MRRTTIVPSLAGLIVLWAFLACQGPAGEPRLGLQPLHAAASLPGQISGTVVLNRTASGTDVPADGARVTLDSSLGTAEVFTRPDGTFDYQYLDADLPLEVTVTASYGGYQEAQVVVMVYAGEETPVELVLELLAPWIQVSPQALEVTLVRSSWQTATLQVANQGLTDLLLPLIEDIPAGTTPETAATRSTTWVETPFAVDEAVTRALEAPGATADLIIWMRARADLGPAYQISDKAVRGQYTFDTLTHTADRTQAPIRRYLEDRGLDYEVYWINNAILVRGGDQALVEAMRPRGDVARIRGVYAQAHIPDPEQLAVLPLGGDSLAANPTWNVTKVNAPEVWEQLGITGEGAVVANIDTGVRYTHQALVGSYRGNLGSGVFDHNYNWGALDGHAPTACDGARDAPCDWHGHGTHTMGTMVGGDGDGPFSPDIGLAPGARWMACMGCDMVQTVTCSDEALAGCAQWVIAPLDLEGQNPDPALAPDVVNNSWGIEGNDDWYYGFVQAWHAADIIPVFSAGNTGPDCGTVGSPGDYENVLGVAGTDASDYNFSSSARGPGLGSSVFPLQKPDLSAPGEYVYSAVNWSDTAYASYSGTSMAAPHVSGLAALMRSANPGITYEQVRDIALSTTVTDTLDIKNGEWCGAGPAYPNYVFGYGRIDALAAVEEAICRENICWLDLEPVSGTVPAGATLPVEVIFDASGLEAGVYTGTLQVHHDDPFTGQILVPVTMTVEGVPWLFVDKSVEPPVQYPGRPVTYTIPFGSEPGVANTVAVKLGDVLPAEVEFISADMGGTYDAGTHEVVWHTDVAPGQTLTATIQGRVRAGVTDSTWLANRAVLAWHTGWLEAQAWHKVMPWPGPAIYLPLVLRGQ
jgi:hypothetical protein